MTHPRASRAEPTGTLDRCGARSLMAEQPTLRPGSCIAVAGVACGLDASIDGQIEIEGGWDALRFAPSARCEGSDVVGRGEEPLNQIALSVDPYCGAALVDDPWRAGRRCAALGGEVLDRGGSSGVYLIGIDPGQRSPRSWPPRESPAWPGVRFSRTAWSSALSPPRECYTRPCLSVWAWRRDDAHARRGDPETVANVRV